MVTESPQAWEHLDATWFSSSHRGLISGKAGEERTPQSTERLKQQHAQFVLTVLLRGMCALRNVDFQLGERAAVLGAAQQWNRFLPGIWNSFYPPYTQGLSPLLPHPGMVARAPFAVLSWERGASSHRNKITTQKSTAEILR